MTDAHRIVRLRMLVFVSLLLMLLATAFVWMAYGPADSQQTAALVASWRLDAERQPAWLMLCGVVLASVIAIPLGAIIALSALLFDPMLTTVYVLLGGTLGGVISYGIGNYLGHDGLQRFAGERVNRISRQLARRGILSVFIIRLLPIAPFAIVNMVAGASHLQLRDFIIGTFLGMLPGTLIIAISIGKLQQWLGA